MQMKKAIPFSTILLAGCASQTSSISQQGQPTEEDYLRFAEKRGEEIYQRDQAAWLATDAVGVNELTLSGTSGWVTRPWNNDWQVRFIGDCENRICVVFDVVVDLSEKTTDITKYEIPPQLEEPQTESWLARQLALQSDFRACSQRYNTVVIAESAAGESRWVVYLLAATTESDLVLIGGHHRITVSNDGSKIIKAEALSNSCLAMEITPETTAVFASHVLDPHPIETHVFTSLNYQLPLYVSTAQARFAVEGSSIRVLSE